MYGACVCVFVVYLRECVCVCDSCIAMISSLKLLSCTRSPCFCALFFLLIIILLIFAFDHCHFSLSPQNGYVLSKENRIIVFLSLSSCFFLLLWYMDLNANSLSFGCLCSYRVIVILFLFCIGRSNNNIYDFIYIN